LFCISSSDFIVFYTSATYLSAILALACFRYKREEVKIQAWENHEKRKAETKMKKMQVSF